MSRTACRCYEIWWQASLSQAPTVWQIAVALLAPGQRCLSPYFYSADMDKAGYRAIEQHGRSSIVQSQPAREVGAGSELEQRFPQLFDFRQRELSNALFLSG